MTPDQYADLKALSKPSTIHSTLADDLNRYEVGQNGDTVLYAGLVDKDGKLIEWMPNHPFINGFTKREPVYAYILGPV